ncbi:MAG: 23S rRNA (adenine(2503)-C(2))-methyltransferase RlmN [Lachnospiraceae bacterium]|jgi:23S rRNA (adenine2503-C2)-methyltransferase
MTDFTHCDTMKTEAAGQDLRSLTPDELAGVIKSLGEKPYRASQIVQWLHQKLVSDYDGMTNIPAALRQKLKDRYPMQPVSRQKVLISGIDGTRKYLFGLSDGNVIESVLMRYSFGNSVCISTQAGCRMGCRFCASTIGGLARNLTPAEMLQEVYEIQKDTGERVTHVVLMGSGEPFDNFDSVVRFLRLITDERGLNISARNITLSTCGLVPEMRRFADLRMQVTMAVSLHAPNDEIRKRIMPAANRYTIAEILDACRYYIDRTGRRVTFEYSLMGGVNDSDRDAEQLARRIAGMQAHVNLIPVNPVSGRDFRSTGRDRAESFRRTLLRCGVNATIRREMGRDINGACGQLRKSFMESGKKPDRTQAGGNPAEDSAQ